MRKATTKAAAAVVRQTTRRRAVYPGVCSSPRRTISRPSRPTRNCQTRFRVCSSARPSTPITGSVRVSRRRFESWCGVVPSTSRSRSTRAPTSTTFDGPDDLLASGYLWEENRKQLAHKPFVIIQPRQRGFVIGFTADPNFRAFADGLNVLFMNAVFRAPMHARPLAATASSR